MSGYPVARSNVLDGLAPTHLVQFLHSVPLSLDLLADPLRWLTLERGLDHDCLLSLARYRVLLHSGVLIFTICRLVQVQKLLDFTDGLHGSRAARLALPC